MAQIMAATGHKSASSVAVYQRVSSKEKQFMWDIITSSVRGEQPSYLSSIMPPHSTSRLTLMPPTQNSSSSTSLVQMRPNTHVSSSVTDVVDILDVNYDDLFCEQRVCETISIIKMLTISKNLVRPRDLESFKGGKFNTLSLVDCYVQICNGTAVEHGSLLNCHCCKRLSQVLFVESNHLDYPQ
jgi:hypothetical protein